MHELTTCCPQCAHCFVISITQLQQRKGYVRCPQCASIFDGFEAVIDDTKPVILPSASPVKVIEPLQASASRPSTASTPEPPSSYEATQAARLAQDLYAPSEAAEHSETFEPVEAYVSSSPSESYETNSSLPHVFREREQFRRANPERTQDALITGNESTYESDGATDLDHDPQLNSTNQALLHLPKATLTTEPVELNTRSRHDETNRSTTCGVTNREDSDELAAQEHTVSFDVESVANTSDFYIAPSSTQDATVQRDFYVSGETSEDSFPHFSAAGQDELIAESEPVYDVVVTEEEPELIGEHTPSGVYPDDEARHAARYATYTETSVWSRLFWRLCLWLLLLLLVAQAAYVYRHQLANQVPFLRPALEAVCQKLDCQISYERRAKLIDISDSELHAEPNTQKNGPYRYHLALSLHNRFKRAQAWPTLVIRLQDGRGQALSTIAVPPEQYLANKGLRSSFFAADSTQRVQLNLSTPERITHYELFSYFP